jgi:hypothetical protein
VAGPTGVLVIQRKGSTVGCGSYHAIDLDAIRTTPLNSLTPFVCKYLRHCKNAIPLTQPPLTQPPLTQPPLTQPPKDWTL